MRDISNRSSCLDKLLANVSSLAQTITPTLSNSLTKLVNAFPNHFVIPCKESRLAATNRLNEEVSSGGNEKNATNAKD